MFQSLLVVTTKRATKNPAAAANLHLSEEDQTTASSTIIKKKEEPEGKSFSVSTINEEAMEKLGPLVPAVFRKIGALHDLHNKYGNKKRDLRKKDLRKHIASFWRPAFGAPFCKVIHNCDVLFS